jgi:xanthine dehydrogenase accessory factor
LFGAGHVGRALVALLAGIPCHVTWVDERESEFPADVPANVSVVVTDMPESEVAAAPTGAYFLVMTHSHPLDQALAEAILRRGDFAYFGLIGSKSKRRQFERRMAARGIPAEHFSDMTCPIGVAGITGKEPATIAVAVAAQLLQVKGRRASHRRLDGTAANG